MSQYHQVLLLVLYSCNLQDLACLNIHHSKLEDVPNASRTSVPLPMVYLHNKRIARSQYRQGSKEVQVAKSWFVAEGRVSFIFGYCSWGLLYLYGGGLMEVMDEPNAYRTVKYNLPNFQYEKEATPLLTYSAPPQGSRMRGSLGAMRRRCPAKPT